MKEINLQIYQFTSNKIYSISNHCTLYSLKPIGVNTPYVESLSSYICRLAEIHNVKVNILLPLIIYPELKSCPSILKGTKGRHFDGFQVNGIGKTTLDFVNVISKLTARNDISSLTLLNYTSIFSKNPKKLITRNKRWCSLCFKENKEKLSPIYEPLLWYIEEISYCDKHNCSLKDKCWRCNCKIKLFFSSKTTLGFCPNCGTDLSEDPSIDKNFELSHKDYLLNKFYKYLLKTNFSLDEYPTKLGIRSLLVHIEKSKILRPYRSAGEILNLSESSIKSWFYGNSSTPSTYFFSILNNFSSSTINEIIENEEIRDLMIKNIKDFLIEKGHIRIDGNKNRNEITDNQIEEILRNFLNSKDYSIGIQKLAKLNGFCATTASRKFPNLCKNIVSNHRLYKRENEEIRIEIEKLLKDNSKIYCAKDVAKMINKSPAFLKNNFPILYKEIVVRYKNYKMESNKFRLDTLKKNIFDAIMHLHKKNIYPTRFKVSKYIGNPYIFLGNKELKEYRVYLLNSLGYSKIEK